MNKPLSKLTTLSIASLLLLNASLAMGFSYTVCVNAPQQQAFFHNNMAYEYVYSVKATTGPSAITCQEFIDLPANKYIVYFTLYRCQMNSARSACASAPQPYGGANLLGVVSLVNATTEGEPPLGITITTLNPRPANYPSYMPWPTISVSPTQGPAQKYDINLGLTH